MSCVVCRIMIGRPAWDRCACTVFLLRRKTRDRTPLMEKNMRAPRRVPPPLLLLLSVVALPRWRQCCCDCCSGDYCLGKGAPSSFSAFRGCSLVQMLSVCCWFAEPLPSCFFSSFYLCLPAAHDLATTSPHTHWYCVVLHSVLL